MELNGDEDGDRGTKDCVSSFERVGLWHVNDTTYSLFHAKEDKIRSYFTPTAACKMDEQVKGKVTTPVLVNDEVLYLLSIVCVGLDFVDRNC